MQLYGYKYHRSLHKCHNKEMIKVADDSRCKVILQGFSIARPCFAFDIFFAKPLTHVSIHALRGTGSNATRMAYGLCLAYLLERYKCVLNVCFSYEGGSRRVSSVVLAE